MFNKILIGAVLAVSGMVSALEAMEREMGEPAVPRVAASLEAMEGEMEEARAPRVAASLEAMERVMAEPAAPRVAAPVVIDRALLILISEINNTYFNRNRMCFTRRRAG